MKRKVCPKKALAVILAASLAVSPTITASAASVGDGEQSLATVTEKTDEASQTESEASKSKEEASKSEDEATSASGASNTGASNEESSNAESETEAKTSDSDENKDTANADDNQSSQTEAGAENASDKTENAGETASDNADVKAGSEETDNSQATDNGTSENSEQNENAEDAESEEADDEDAPLFEEVDPEEEGLEDPSTALEGEAADIPVEEKDPEEQTRVIIVMEGDSVLDAGYDTENLAENDAAMNLSENIVAQQEEQVEKISEEALDGEDLDVNYNLSILTNAVSADVAYKDIENIEKVDGVAAVYVATQYDPQETADPQTITSGDMIGSYEAWATGYTGAGTRIAIIDTGIDADHPSFDGAAFDAHLAETAEDAGRTIEDYDLLDAAEIEAVLPNLNASQRSEGVSADQLYLSDKIPYAFNYVDKNLDVTHDNDDEGDHGTHVSGIATANAYVPNSEAETGYSRQHDGVVGVAPDAQLITMKVFGTNGGAYSDDYMAAIEDAILLKADVVNLSLGSSAAGYSSDSEAYINEIFKKLEGTSTVVSISAGNAGRWADNSTYGVNLSGDVNQDTVGSPGSYYNAFTVASAVNSGFTGNYFIAEDGENIFYTAGNDTLAPGFQTLDTSADQNGTDYPYVFLDAKGLPEDYEGVDVADKIVFVQRGGLTFGEKQMNAEAAGAKAVVIYNNQPGTISMTLQGSTAVIPAVSITLAEGLAIAKSANQVSEKVYEGTLKVIGNVTTNYEAADGYTMSDFSSYGVPGSLDLKPEITAPGGNIFSTRDDGTYGNMSGTSMSAPSIAGQSALVEQYIRENGLADKNDISVRSLAQSLLMSTAIPLHEDNDPEGLEVSPRSQGAGLANVHSAVTSPSYILVGDKNGNDGKAKVVLGDDPQRTGSYSFSFDVYNMSENPQYYVLDASVLTEQLYDEEGITYFAGSSHKLNPEITLTADDTALVYDLNSDGKVNSKDRKVLLQVVNGSKELSLVTEHEDYFDFNKDGLVDTKDVYLFGKQLKNKADVADFGLRVMQVKDSTKVNVTINLSDSDREYLAGFENGMYVDGFVYVNGVVPLSVPFLAFYGSWMDSSMFENFDFMKYVHDEEYAENASTYVGLARTNFLSVYPLGDEEEDFYIPNLFAKDDEYIADRNAISPLNGTVLGSQYYTLIRNANRVILSITDKNTGEEYFKHTEYENYAAFIYDGQWQNHLQAQDLNWAGTDAEGNPLPEGTEVNITLEAVPSYYDNVEDPSTLDGKGLYMTTPVAIDNTNPVVADAVKNKDGGYDLTLYDNRYTAAVLLIGSDKKTIIGRYAVNQQNKDEDVVLSVEAPEDVFYVEVFDYACNASVYRFNNTGHADTKFVTELSVDKESLELNVGDTAKVTATVGPKWLAEGYNAVEWMSSDEDVVLVNQNGVVKALTAGKATVMVATLATNKKGEHLVAKVEVTVTDPSEVSDGNADDSDKDAGNNEDATQPTEDNNDKSSDDNSEPKQENAKEENTENSEDDSNNANVEENQDSNKENADEAKSSEGASETSDDTESSAQQKADENTSDDSNKDDSAEGSSTDDSVNQEELGGENHE
ncbi:S8 family serine peptidase [Butyrivibrio sp. JL13D10]|uniref:S8 family serine peptidase n=1 Tax=Butyrivibrio sp. JL13D10 TaxID=3236815 RepID=UPI0038B49173